MQKDLHTETTETTVMFVASLEMSRTKSVVPVVSVFQSFSRLI